MATIPSERSIQSWNDAECHTVFSVDGIPALHMSVTLRHWLFRVSGLGILAGAVMPGCGSRPEPEEARTRLVGVYRLQDRRASGAGVNPELTSATLTLSDDGKMLQECKYKDGSVYRSSGAAWSYRGDGNVHLSSLKDCSWVYGEVVRSREGPLEAPKGGGSLIVEWSSKPVIVLHPDVNAYYQWENAPPARP